MPIQENPFDVILRRDRSLPLPPTELDFLPLTPEQERELQRRFLKEGCFIGIARRVPNISPVRYKEGVTWKVREGDGISLLHYHMNIALPEMYEFTGALEDDRRRWLFDMGDIFEFSCVWRPPLGLSSNLQKLR